MRGGPCAAAVVRERWARRGAEPCIDAFPTTAAAAARGDRGRHLACSAAARRAPGAGGSLSTVRRDAGPPRPGRRLRGWCVADLGDGLPDPGGELSDEATALLHKAVQTVARRGYAWLKPAMPKSAAESLDWAPVSAGAPLTGWEAPPACAGARRAAAVGAGVRRLRGIPAAKLAEALMDQPLWGEVTISACTVFASRDQALGVAANRKRALAARYTDTADRAALERVMAEHHAVFTPLGITVGGIQPVAGQRPGHRPDGERPASPVATTRRPWAAWCPRTTR